MEVPRLGYESELQLPATATPDLSHVFNLYHSSQQCRILNPLSEAQNRTHNLMVPSWIRFHCATMELQGLKKKKKKKLEPEKLDFCRQEKWNSRESGDTDVKETGTRVPAVAKRDLHHLYSARTQIRSPAHHSRLKDSALPQL